mgnify:CR=1 FL=1
MEKKITVEFRLYKRFDADLLALQEQGLSISSMAKTALEAYANGTPVHFLLPECKLHDLVVREYKGKKKNSGPHTRIKVKDPATVDLINNIKIKRS